jgi:hypothetical protein
MTPTDLLERGRGDSERRENNTMKNEMCYVEVNIHRQSNDNKPFLFIHIRRYNNETIKTYPAYSCQPIQKRALRLTRGIHLLAAVSKRAFEQEIEER